MKESACFQIIIVFALIFTACKSKPITPETVVPETEAVSSPFATLAFTGIQADDVEHLRVSFNLEVNAPSASRARIESWRVLIDGQDVSPSFSLNYPKEEFTLGSTVQEGNLAFQARREIPLTLSMDIAALAAKGLAPKDDYAVTLTADLDVFSGTAVSTKITAQRTAEFPGIQEPRFIITSIAVLKAELINTRFRVNMRIDNPNPFPLEMSGLSYELYGNGRRWADGTDKNSFVVNGRSSVQGSLYLLMNFIDMDRNLLNQIVNLVDVNYHFTGEAQVSTGIDYLPKFKKGFDLSGYSEVLDK
jgi:LEA14-like dessication related protein